MRIIPHPGSWASTQPSSDTLGVLVSDDLMYPILIRSSESLRPSFCRLVRPRSGHLSCRDNRVTESKRQQRE